MRHGPAEDHAPSGRDFDRQLTPAGRARTEQTVRDLVKRGERPKRVLSSPLIRAVQTAEIVRSILDLEGAVQLREELAPGGPSLELMRELVEGGAKRVLLVGHEPDVSLLTTSLLQTWSRGFDKAMIVGLRVDRAAWSDASSDATALCRFVIHPARDGN